MHSVLWSWMIEYPLSSFAVAMVLFGWLGHTIVTQYLMEEQIRSMLSKVTFIATFMCSVALLALYLYEICGIKIPEALCTVILATLVCLCVLVIPMSLIIRFPLDLNVKCCGRRVPTLKAVMCSLYIYGLVYFAENVAVEKEIEEVELFSKVQLNIFLEIVLNNGMYIMALMSAYGSIWCPYIYFNYIETHQNQLAQAKGRTLEEIHFIIDQIKKNKLELLNLSEKEQAMLAQFADKPLAAQSFLARGLKTLASFIRSDAEQELPALRQKKRFHQKELETLKIVHHQSFEIYKEIVDQERKHLIRATWTGKLFRLFSFVLMVYSVTKVALTIWNMLKGRAKLSTDPITRLLNFYTTEDTDLMRYSKSISFGFMGYLMISSVRSFSMNIKNFFNYAFRRRKLSILETDTRVLFLSLIYGIYFLSAVILLQSSLPKMYVTRFEEITGKVGLLEHYTLFDKLFFYCCVGSAAFIFFCEYQRNKRMNYIIKERNMVDSLA